MRTIIVSDAHGFPSLVHNAVKDAGDFDQLIFAGDALDIGPDPNGVLAALKEYDATCLMGNHDAAALLHQRIHPQDPVSFLIAEENRAWMGQWPLEMTVDGVLVSHAGMPMTYPYDIARASRDDNSPLWYRPYPGSLTGPQVVGHTPIESYPLVQRERFKADGIHFIDPYARRFYQGTSWGEPVSEWFRYAVIEGGRVEVKEWTP